VTFLLTDIEGSTRLLERLGDDYTGLLRDVRGAIRTSVRAASGYEVDARADEFFAVFRRSTHALDAALAIQRALRDKTWPQKADVRVRIGMHTGRPRLPTRATSESQFISPRASATPVTAARSFSRRRPRVLHRTSRRRRCLPEAGRFSLHGIAEPEALFQVNAADLPAKFPRPRTIDQCAVRDRN